MMTMLIVIKSSSTRMVRTTPDAMRIPESTLKQGANQVGETSQPR